jgi:hypothetical protein
MKKPFCATSTEVLEHINPAKPVYVYRNLHKKCLSVKQGGIVRCHAKNVVLKDCDFIVWIAGQTKVRKEKKKNVHAFLFGYVSTSTTANELLDFGWHSVYYNPYACEHWQLENEPFDQYVDRAKWVDVHADSLGASVLAFDIIYKKDLCPA